MRRRRAPTTAAPMPDAAEDGGLPTITPSSGSVGCARGARGAAAVSQRGNMLRTLRSSVRLAVAFALVLTVAGCSSSGDDGEPAESSTTSSAAGDGDETSSGRAPEEISAPPAEGKGINLPQPAAPTPDGYVTEE